MRQILIFCGMLLVCGALLLFAPLVSTGSALPEYAAQTGEPCSSCHISPSGGGARGPRGQAWVASDKPSSVPDLAASLELLGVEMKDDPAYFSAGSGPVSPAEPLERGSVNLDRRRIFELLSGYEGN